MTATPNADDRIHEWIRKELDVVSEPHRAVREAIQASTAVRQRHARRGIRAWLADRDQSDPDHIAARIPEVVLDATVPHAMSAQAAAATPIAGPRRLAIALIVSAVAVVSGAYVISLADPVPSGPGGESVRLGAMALDPALEGGREILVTPDGSGHFYTISDAVDAALDGDRITVMPGSYEESIQITGKKIDIVGQGGAEAVEVRPSSTGPVQAPDGYANLDAFGGSASLSNPDTQLPSEWRYVLYLDDSDARISDLSLIGSEVGSAIIIRGGTPQLDRLIVDPVGSQTGGRPEAPHEGVSIYGSSTASLRDNLITGLVSVWDASSPSFSNNTIRGTCVVISGEGSDPTLIGNTIESGPSTGQCPYFNVAIDSGASPTVDSNDIAGDQRTDGIRVLGLGTNPTIQGNNVMGADAGIWVGGEASGLIIRNDVTGAQTGIRIVGANPQVEINGFYQNAVGVSIDATSRPQFAANSVCDNDTNVVLAPGQASLQSQNPDICADDQPGGGE